MNDTGRGFKRLLGRRDFLKRLGAGALGLTAVGGMAGRVAAKGKGAADKPNFVIVFTDDQGYADVGCFGAEGFKTPHLDRMAAEGVRFTDFYAASCVCTPSRAALLTGCYPQRVGLPNVLGPRSNTGISDKEQTIAEVLKPLGYATACYGKWHLGHHKKFLPTRHGFDDYFGLPYSNDMWPYHPGVAHLPMAQRLRRWPHLPLIEGDKVINPKVTAKDQENLTTWYTERACKFIEANKDRPFFVYVPHSMCHVPLFVSDKFKGKSKQGLFGDVIMEIDWSVGRILATLKRLGLDEKTFVMFTSDNGPWLSYGERAGSAKPLREGKGTTFDGGQREACIMRWPGKIPAGKAQREMATTMDILPTIAKLAGAKPPANRIDGKDIRPLMTCQAGAKTPHEAFYFYRGWNLEAVRSGKWKLHFPHGYRSLPAGGPRGKGGRPVRYQSRKIGLALFDLENDVGETKNVADKHPDVVKRLGALAQKMREDIGDGRKPGKNRRPPGRI